MELEKWNVSAKLIGDFFIKDEHHITEACLIDGLRQLTISPEIGNNGEWTGIHELNALFELNENEAKQPNIVFESGKHIVDSIVAIISLATARTVHLSGSISVRQRISEEPPKFRILIGQEKVASLSPPTPLSAQLLGMSINSTMLRVIRWYSHALATNDSVDRLISLNNALDILAGMVKDVPTRSRMCKNCGYEETIGPGLRERVVYFLTKVSDCSEASANSIYESRIDLAHARSNLTEDDLRKYREQSRLLINVLRFEISRQLSITLPPLPSSIPFDLPSAFMDIVYEDKSSSENPESRSE